jgi:o-succinylbenzoate synthase
MQASVEKHTLQFSFPAGTSRGVLHEKDSWFIRIWDESNPAIVGIGECSIIPKLSIDDVPELEEVIAQTIDQINTKGERSFSANKFPALEFAIETALLDLQTGGKQILFPSGFTQQKAAIPINGLIWMDSFDSMWQQAVNKFAAGFKVLKMKVGALNFDEEVYFIKQLRKEFSTAEIRLDANGAFPADEALDRLKVLAEHSIHSIEQPIAPKQLSSMQLLCKKSPIAIALDEELIGINTLQEKENLLRIISPQYIILKPSLLGGFRACDEWISVTEKQQIAWWATSALESNIVLNAIAQWVFTKENPLPQGLGTGGLYTNNVPSTLEVKNGMLYYKKRFEN